MSARRWSLLALVLAFAFGLRLAAAAGVQAVVDREPGRLCLIAGDATGYWALARTIVRGEPYRVYDPPRYVLRMPGFPALLAAGMAVFGERPLLIRTWLAAVGTLGCAAAFLLARELFRTGDPAGESAAFDIGLWAAGISAVSPALTGFSVLFLSEVPFGVGLTLSCWCFARLAAAVRGSEQAAARARHAIFWGGATGLAGAAACAMRPSWLLAPLGAAVLLAATARERRVSILGGASIVVALGVALAPWTYRNWLVTGRFVPTTLWYGPSLYDGLRPGATGDSDMRFIEEDGVYRRMSEYEADRHYAARAKAWTWAHPGEALRLAWIKQLRFWSLWPNAREAGAFAGAVAGFTLLLYSATAAGMVEGVRQGWRVPCAKGAAAFGCPPRLPSLWILFCTVGPVLYFAGLHAVFVGSVRYRLPAEFSMSALAAYGLRTMIGRVSWRGSRAISG